MASYFDMNTGSAESETERIVESRHHDFFDVANVQDIDFIDSAGKPNVISNISHRAAVSFLYQCGRRCSAFSVENSLT